MRRVGIHGARGTGKSCFLAGLYGQRATKGGAVNFPDDATITVLTRLWDCLQAGGRPDATALGLPDELRLQLFADREAWEVFTRDYAGALVQRSETGMPELRADVKDWLLSCQAVLFFLGADADGPDVRERVNELGLLVAGLKALSPDGNTIARPLALVLTKWDTAVDQVSDDDEREQGRALEYLETSAALREAADLLRQCGDRVRVFPVSAFGANRDRVLPPSGGPSPRLLHAPLVWAARQTDEMLLEQAARRAGARVEGRVWPDYAGAVAAFDAFYREAGVNRGPVYDQARRLAVPLRRKLWVRRAKLGGVAVLALAALGWYGIRHQQGEAAREYEVLAGFRQNHSGDEFAEERNERAGAYLASWRNKQFGAASHQRDVEAWRQDDEVSAKAYQEKLDFESLEKVHASLSGPANAAKRLELAERSPLRTGRFGPRVSQWLHDDRREADAYREEQTYQKARADAEAHAREGRFAEVEKVWQAFVALYPKSARKAEVDGLIAEAKQGRFDKEWNDLKAFSQANPDGYDELIKRHVAFADKAGVPVSKRDQARADVVAYREAWDRREYEKVRDAAREAKDDKSVLVVKRLAEAYLDSPNTAKARRKEIENWLGWFNGLQNEKDYTIQVRSLTIPADSALAKSIATEEPRVHVRLNETSHVTDWKKGRDPVFNQDLGPFRYKWGTPATLKVEVEEYDSVGSNDWARGEAKEDAFVLFRANGAFVARCDNNKEVTVYLECPAVVPPGLPAYK